MSETTEYPLNASTLNKGDCVTVEQLEVYLSMSRDNPEFRLRVLRARDFVIDNFSRRGDPATVLVKEKIGLVVLTDEEAVPYNLHVFENETKGRSRALTRLVQTNRANLTPGTRDLLDRKVVELGHRVQVDRRLKNQFVAPPAHRRITPGR